MGLFNIVDLVLLLLGGSGAASRLTDAACRWFWKSVSESWPTSPATILSGRVRESEGLHVVSAPYSFYAAGDRYGGRYERKFHSEARAQEALQRLLGSPPAVRYRPGHPDRSILSEN
jgi:hypothetical protein